ncbi:MAG: S8 family serine peptidase, partial [Nocardioidaceae bacterium]
MARTPSFALAGLIALLLPIAVSQPSADAAPAPTDTTIGTVTLLTGDRVTIGAPVGGKPTVIVDPAERHQSAGFSIRRDGGHVEVVPTDVAALVPRVLDPALFDVTALLDKGYGDAERARIPLIVRRGAGVARLSDDSPLDATATLSSIDATAAELDKSDAAAFGDDLESAAPAGARTTAAALGGATKIWLDDQVRTTEFDQYLQQVSAPAAWESGLDGEGVDVAVLDTGVDAGHPVLDGAVGLEQNFSDTATAADGNGHGTHVASLIAGNGAGSDGARQGIAPGAGILSGKVLDDDGFGQQSWVIDGMEWAADQDADIVNLSLGGPPTAGDDPVAQSLDRLTAETGTLFVVAAGNRGGLGRHPETIDSPGSAASALTVGATRADGDGTAGFSGEGPTRGTYRLKPDVAAPGVDILGARAGARTGDLYTPMSGTSQATPIVAGAAALLAQLHPGWTPAEIKARVVTTATQGAYQSSWTHGGGRLDLARATAPTLTSDTASLDFGYLRHPEEAAAERRITLSNPGADPVTVTATGRVIDEDGTVAADGVLTASPATVTVPAGGTAATTVRFDPGRIADGMWQGGLSFSADGNTLLRLPFGVYDEPERYDMNLTVIDRNGEPYRPAAADTHPMAGPTVSLFNADNGYSYQVPLDDNGEGSARVAPGHYGVVGRIATTAEDGRVSFTFAGTTEVEVSHDTDYVVDARNGKRLRPPRIAGQPTTVEQATMMASRHSEAGPGLTELGFFSPAEIEQGRVFVEPNAYPRTGRYDTDLQWRLEPTGSTRPRTPDAYELDLTDRRLPDTTDAELTRRDVSRLARVRSDFHSIDKPADAYQVRAYMNSNTGIGIQHEWPLRVPAGEVDLRTAGAAVQWSDCLDLAPSRMRAFCDSMHSYEPGSRVTSDFASGLHATAVDGYRSPSTLVVETGLGDGTHAGKVDGRSVKASAVVLRNGKGEVLGRNDDSFGYFGVAPAARSFRLTHRWTLRPDWFTSSTRTDWTFHSAPPKDPTTVGATPLPLMTVDYGPTVDGRGRAEAGRPLPFHLSFDHLRDSDATRRIA